MGKSFWAIGCIFTLLFVGSGCKYEKLQDHQVDILGQQSSKSELENCVTWFDGCNTCFVEAGHPNGCTERFCLPEQRKKRRCTEYKKQ